MDLEELPDSVLLEILQYLSYDTLCLGVRMTNKRFYTLSNDPSLWKLIEIPHHFTDDRFLLLLRQVHLHVEGLELSQCEKLTVKALDALGDLELPKLKHLAIPISGIFPDQVFEKFVKSSPDLEELENICANEEDTCHPVVCQSLFSKLKVVHDKPVSTYGRLRRIILRPSVADDNIRKRKQWLNNLTLVSNRCPNVTSYHCRRGLDYLNDKSIPEVAKLFPNLEELELHYCAVGDEGIVGFFAHHKGNLKSLILDNTEGITDNGILKIVNSLTHLHRLKIARCSKITNEAIQCLVHHCPYLQEVTLNNNMRSMEYTDETVIQLADSCRHLVSLNVFKTTRVTKKSIKVLQKKCTSLRGLLLFECPNIDDEALDAVACMSQLRSLVLMNCDEINPEGVVNVVLKSPYLHRLTLFGKTRKLYGDMSDLGNKIYSKIDQNPHEYLPNVIRVLNLKGVGGELVQLMTVLCPNLHTLDLREDVPLTVPSLSALLKNCDALQVLDIAQLPKLDDTFILNLCSYGQGIRKISFGNSILDLTTDGLEKLVSRCLSLKTICIDQSNAKLDEEYLLFMAKESHGGHYFLHEYKACPLLEDEVPDTSRYIEIYLTPIKYLCSVPIF